MLMSEHPVAWRISTAPVGYQHAVNWMEERVLAIRNEGARETVWLLEHPPLYTAGTSAKPDDLLEPDRFPVFKTSRGGQFTYHGPGQRIAYVLLDLERRGRDIRAFVQGLENWIIDTLAEFNIKGEVREGRVGVWIDRSQSGGSRREDKIAAIGVRIRKWVSFHGISLNIEPDLTHFSGITPCGIQEDGLGVTSLVDLGLPVSMNDADAALRKAFERNFGPTLEE
ncbi:MAG: lipoyl(octanoyl) transferase LipB [Hyphococcus sp.]